MNRILASASIAGLLLTPLHAEKSTFPYKFVTDTGFYYASSHEGRLPVSSNLLNRAALENIPFSLGTWNGRELNSASGTLLLFREYENQRGQTLYFIGVHGTQESEFHTAEVCYINDGWKFEKREYRNIPLWGEEFQVRYDIARHGNVSHLLMYWYMWSDSRRNMADGCTLFRISVDIDDDEESAAHAAIDFIKQLTLYASGSSSLVQKIALVEEEAVEWKTAVPGALEALSWIKGQIVPNEAVPQPYMERRGLVLSYEIPKDDKDYRYVYSKAALYDNALAVIALTMAGEDRLVTRLLDAVRRLVGEDGTLWFSYNTHNDWPSPQETDGAVMRTGASAWMGYAVCFHIRHRLHDGERLEGNGELSSYLAMAEQIGDRLLKGQVRDAKDPRFGLLTGGEGSYRLEFTPDRKDVIENFYPETVPWCSIEHNIDAYFLFRDLGLLTGKPVYRDAAKQIRASLLEKGWNNSAGQFNRGQRLEGPDRYMALDCASWAGVFCLAAGDQKKAARSLKSVENYASLDRGVKGYKPYREGTLHENVLINRFFYPDEPRKGWKEMELVWPEGSLGVAMAYLKSGKPEKARSILAEMNKLQAGNGGIVYATKYIAHEFSSYPSMASAAWYVMMAAMLEDPQMADLFWGR